MKNVDKNSYQGNKQAPTATDKSGFGKTNLGQTGANKLTDRDKSGVRDTTIGGVKKPIDKDRDRF